MSTLSVGNNRLQLKQLDLQHAPHAEQGQLVAIVVRAQSTLELYGLVLRSAFGQLGTAENSGLYPIPGRIVDGHAAWLSKRDTSSHNERRAPRAWRRRA